MKTKYWALILCAVFLLSAGAAAYIYFHRTPAKTVTVISDGETVAVLDLSQDTQITVPYKDGSNTVTVRDGKVSVTDATCPDKYCMQRGAADCGIPIICLPNRLVLQFSTPGTVDALVG